MRVSKADKMGSYLCRVGAYEIRQKITFPQASRGYTGAREVKGSTEGRIYRGKKLVEGNFTNAFAAIKKAYHLVCREGTTHNVARKIVNRYNLSC